MDIQNALIPFRRRLCVEALVHAAVFGGCAGWGSLILLLTASRLWGAPSFLAASVFAVSFACIAATFFALRLRPSWAGTAARLDALGLEERVQTMVHYQGASAAVYTAQRGDALLALSRLTPEQLKIRWPVRGAAFSLALAATASILAFAPFGTVSSSPAPESAEARLIREMIDGLREQVKGAQLTEEQKQDLLGELERIQTSPDEADLDALAAVTQAVGEISQTLTQLEWSKSWAYTLTQYGSLRTLAEAILAHDEAGVRDAIADLEEGLLNLAGKGQLDALMEIKTSIQAALEEGDPDDGEAYLCYAFDSLSNDLEAAAVYLFSQKDPAPLINQGFERFQKRVCMYLSGEESWEKTETTDIEDAAFALHTTAENADGEGAPGSRQNSTGAQGQSSEGGQTLYSADPQDRHGAGTATRDKQYYAQTELIYEPALDAGAAGDGDSTGRSEVNVPYGQVYGVYYAKLLKAIDQGEIPEPLIEAVESYFYGL